MPPLKTYLTHKNIFLFGLFLVIVGMPLSKFLMSIGQFLLLANWIFEGDFKGKWQVIRTSKVLWVISSFYILHLVGLFWTSDFAYAANDLKIKLPLLWFPLLFITSKQTATLKEIQGLLWFFTASVFIASIVCTMVWLGYTKHKVIDIRDISIFNSHIRFALMIDLVICFLIYDFFKTGKAILYLAKLSLIIWLIVFLGIMQSFTGIVIVGVILVYYNILFLKRLNKPFLKISAFSVIGIIAGIAIYMVFKEVKGQSVPTKPIIRLDKTPAGKYYYNDYATNESENGNLVWANICVKEIESEWNKRSSIKFNEIDKKGNPIFSTLIRYMSSKGYSKDLEGIYKLSVYDVFLIENGTTNYLYTNKSGLESRIHEVIYEYESYKKGKNPTGHSFLMRLEFWRIGWQIIKRKPVYGVGTGDLQRAYNYQYQMSGTKLSKDWWKRSHNQFMSITIGFGTIGLVVFLCYLFYPLIAIKNKHYLFSAFFIISLLSMFNEDTLETQAGVTFFGLFYSFLLFSVNNKELPKNKKEISAQNLNN
jgi:hypothetical protein